jgi:hypothetical protein
VVGDRIGRAEHGHDGVAGELVQHAAVGTDRFGHGRQVPADDVGDLPGRDLLGEGGEPRMSETRTVTSNSPLSESADGEASTSSATSGGRKEASARANRARSCSRARYLRRMPTYRPRASAMPALVTPDTAWEVTW